MNAGVQFLKPYIGKIFRIKKSDPYTLLEKGMHILLIDVLAPNPNVGGRDIDDIFSNAVVVKTLVKENTELTYYQSTEQFFHYFEPIKLS